VCCRLLRLDVPRRQLYAAGVTPSSPKQDSTRPTEGRFDRRDKVEVTDMLMELGGEILVHSWHFRLSSLGTPRVES